MPIACVRIPHFALRVALLTRPELDGAPLVLGAPPDARPVVLDTTPEAASRGIRPGMLLREATALCPEAVILAPDPLREADVTADLLARLEALSPRVAPDPDEPGDAYVDLLGLSRLLGPPAAIANRVLSLAPPLLRPRVGVAPGLFTARVAAGLAPPGTARIVGDANVVAFLAPVAVTWLPLPPATHRRLERLGIWTLGDLAALPASAVAARFGPSGRAAWELATGRDTTSVQPRERPETVIEKLEFPTPATSRETFLIALRQLVSRAFERTKLRDRAVRQIRLRAWLEGGGSWEQVATLKEPVGRDRLGEALRLRFGNVNLPGPIEAVELMLSGLSIEIARQAVFDGLRPRRVSPLDDAVRQLKQRYGASPLSRIVEVEPWSRLPERRHALISYDP
jgi:hypothetical protein